MAKTQKRKIHLNEIEYEWCIRGNDLWGTSEKYITIYKTGINGRPLYLDPYPWALEIRPETIKKAIEFASQNGWIPEKKGKPFLIGYLNKEFVVLPEGITNTHEYEEMLKKQGNIKKCLFCNPVANEPIIKNRLAYALYDKYPVSRGHILIIPFRHYPDYFDSTIDERNALFDLINECKKYCDNEFNPDGYNIGINIGEPAGQTIFHLHIHLIPRYTGDMKDPTGGVRGVIPEKQKY